MIRKCFKCEAAASATARFCPRCGHALPADTQPTDERVREESVTVTAYQYDSEASIAVPVPEASPSIQPHDVAPLPSRGGCEICSAVTEEGDALCKQCRKLTLDKVAEHD